MTDTTLSNIEAEATNQFAFVMKQLGYRYGTVRIPRAYDGHDETKRVRLRTKSGDQAIEGVIVFKNEDGQWQLYCAASDIDFGDWHASFSFDKETQTYRITKFFNSGGCEPMTVNLVTGEQKVFCDPAD